MDHTQALQIHDYTHVIINAMSYELLIGHRQSCSAQYLSIHKHWSLMFPKEKQATTMFSFIISKI